MVGWRDRMKDGDYRGRGVVGGARKSGKGSGVVGETN